MKNKIINYFFEEEEMDLVENYKSLLKVAVICLITGFIALIVW